MIRNPSIVQRSIHIAAVFASLISLSACEPPHSSQTTLNYSPQPRNAHVARIHRAIPAYQQLAQQTWPEIHLKTNSLRVGMSDPAIPLLQKRLTLLGDFHPKQPIPSDAIQKAMPPAVGNRYTPILASAVKQFQWRHGLKASGVIGKRTLAALNVTPAQRLSQLYLNEKRWSEFPHHVGSEYIKVNVANFELDVIKEGESVLNMKVIAGRKSRPTPTIYSKLETIVFNPKWNVPSTIAREDIVPKILENPNYLSENNINIYSSWERNAYKIDPNTINWSQMNGTDFPYRLTQEPGYQNALGRVKFIFMNNDDIYLHDTPQKGLFTQIQRAFSSGCVRLEKPFQLVEYFVKKSVDEEDPALSHEKIESYLSEGKTKYIRIKNPIPIYITYITAWVDKHGYSHFREDVYERDLEGP